jgi:two-component system sensor histidine kinase YesM
MPVHSTAQSLFKSWFGRRFYNRLFLINAVIFIVVVYSFGLFATVITARLDISSHVQNSLDALTAVCNEYDLKHDNFSNIIQPLFASPSNYATISEIMEGNANANLLNDAFFRQRVTEMIQSMTTQDKDITAVLLHRRSDGADFVYSVKGQFFSQAPAGFPFVDQLKEKAPYSRAIYGVRMWKNAEQLERTYAIAGSILSTNHIFSDAGSILVAYDVTRLHRLLQGFDASTSGRFLIVAKDGDVIFDSAQHLYGSKYNHMELLSKNGESAVVDGAKSIIQIANHSKRNFYGLFIESDSMLNDRIAGGRLLIFAICTVISLLSAVLYLLAGVLSTRRVRELEHGMDNVGSNNLAYRIPLQGLGDEFKHIAVRFNLMCDELQNNINKLYVNEIKQKSAELSALQSGLNPHFLYNTLEAIRSKVQEDGSDEAAELIALMAGLLRNLVHSQKFIPIHQEMHFCCMYLDLFVLRYTDGFEYYIEVEPAIRDFGVPKGILQPVLENYFVHGIREGAADNKMDITGKMIDGWIVFRIEDNGKGIDAARLNEIQPDLQGLDASRTTYGLANVHDRMRLVYGPGSGIQISRDASNGRTVVQVSFRPMTCEELDKSISVARENLHE